MHQLTAPMDFEGQRRAEWLIHIIISTSGAGGIVYGWFEQDFSRCVYSIFAGILLCILLVVPNWPFYKGTEMKWVDDALVDRYEAQKEEEAKAEKTKEKEKEAAKDDAKKAQDKRKRKS
eukprot:EG_transcript_43582